MPAYNASAVIERALSSIEKQARPVDEVVIVDDGSADNTYSKITAWKDRLPLKIIRNERNLGIAGTLKRGVEFCTSDWAFRLDADDSWHSCHVLNMEHALAKEPDAVLVTAPVILVDETGQRISQKSAPMDVSVRADLMWDNPFTHSATGFLCDAYRAVGGYKEGVRWEDYDLWIRLLNMGKLVTAHGPSVDYTVAKQSLSRTKRSIALKARYACQRAAIQLYWRRHPIAALRSKIVGELRNFGAQLL